MLILVVRMVVLIRFVPFVLPPHSPLLLLLHLNIIPIRPSAINDVAVTTAAPIATVFAVSLT